MDTQLLQVPYPPRSQPVVSWSCPEFEQIKSVYTTEANTANRCKTKDVLPEMELKGTKIDLVEEAKVLGAIISSNLSWSSNTDYIVERCNKKP